MGATQPLPDETPSLVPPARVPPVTTGTMPPSGRGGGGRPYSFRWFRILALTLLTGGVGALAVLAWAIPKRAPTLVVALLFLAIGLIRHRRELRSPESDFFPGELYRWSIAGGVVGELVAQLVFHIDPGAPATLLWLLLGAGGIGGACGFGVGALGSLGVTGVVGGWTIWRNSASAA